VREPRPSRARYDGAGKRRLPRWVVVGAVVLLVVLAAVVATVVLRLNSPSDGRISAAELAEGAEEALEARAGARPRITCPSGLDAEVGATARCTLTAGDDSTEFGVGVSVTSVDGDSFTVSVQVDEEPVE